MKTKMSPTEVVLAWNEAYTRRDVDATLEFMSEDFFRVGDSTNWAPVDKKEWGRQMRTFFAAFPDWSWDLTSLTATEDRVVCEFTEHGPFTKPFEILPGLTLRPTGTAFVDHDCDWFRINEDGLIAEIHAYVTNNLEREYHFVSQIMEFLGMNK
jgi:steroid delta-isomerase-like uncharacterized protein